MWSLPCCLPSSQAPLRLCLLASSLTSLETMEKSRSNFLKSRGLSLVGLKLNLSVIFKMLPQTLKHPYTCLGRFGHVLLSHFSLFSLFSPLPKLPCCQELCDPWQGHISFPKQSWLAGTSFNLPRKHKEVDCLSQVQRDGGGISLAEFGLFSIFIPVSHLTLALYTQHQCLPEGLLGVKYSVACFWGPGC